MVVLEVKPTGACGPRRTPRSKINTIDLNKPKKLTRRQKRRLRIVTTDSMDCGCNPLSHAHLKGKPTIK